MKKSKGPPLSEGQLLARLRVRYAPPAWAFLSHVRNRTGYGRGPERTADGLAMQLYPSRGLELHGFELKSSRSDWLRELERPDKADAIAKYCDRWWIVAGRADLVLVSEVPKTWGLLLPQGDGLRAAKEPLDLDPVQVDLNFLAAILRRAAASQDVGADEFEERYKQRLKDAVESATSSLRYDLQRSQTDQQEMRKAIHDFEQLAGIQIQHWRAGNVGKAVQFVLQGNIEEHTNRLQALQRQAENIAAALKQLLAVAPPAPPRRGTFDFHPELDDHGREKGPTYLGDPPPVTIT